MTTTVFKFPNISELETTLHVLSDKFTMFSSIFFLQSNTFANLKETRKQEETHNLITKIIKYVKENHETVTDHSLYKTFINPLNVLDIDSNIDNLTLYYLYCIYNSLKKKQSFSLIILSNEKILQHVVIENEKRTLVLYYDPSTKLYKPVFTSQIRMFPSNDSVIEKLLKMYKKTDPKKNEEYVPFEHSFGKDLSIHRRYTENVQSFMSSIFYCFLDLLDPDLRLKSIEIQQETANELRDVLKTYLLSLYETQSIPDSVVQKITLLFKDYPVQFSPDNENILLHLNENETLIESIRSDDTTHGHINFIPILEYMTNVKIYLFKSPDTIHINNPDSNYDNPIGFMLMNTISEHEFIPVLYSLKNKKNLVHHPIIFNNSDANYIKIIKKLHTFYNKHLKQFNKSMKTKKEKVESEFTSEEKNTGIETTTEFEEVVDINNTTNTTSDKSSDDQNETTVHYEKFIIDGQNVKFEPWNGHEFTYTSFATNPIINYSPQEITHKLHNLLNTSIPYHNTFIKIFQEINNSSDDKKTETHIDRKWYFPIISFNKPFYIEEDENQDEPQEGDDFFYQSIYDYIDDTINVKNTSKQNLYDIPIYNNANVNDKNYISIPCNKMCVRNCFDSPCSKIPLDMNKFKTLDCLRDHVYDNQPVRKAHALEFYSVMKHDKINQRGFVSIHDPNDMSDINVFDIDVYVNSLIMLSTLTQFDNVNVILCYKTKATHRIIEYDTENKCFILKSNTDDSFDKYIFDADDIVTSLAKNNFMMYIAQPDSENEDKYMYSKIDFFQHNIAFLTNIISVKECEMITIPSVSNYFDYLHSSKTIFGNVEHLYTDINYFFGIDKQHETDDISQLIHVYFLEHSKNHVTKTSQTPKTIKKKSLQPLNSELDFYNLKKHNSLYEDLFYGNDVTDLHKAFHIHNKNYAGVVYMMDTYGKPLKDKKITSHIEKIEKHIPTIENFHSKHEYKISTYANTFDTCGVNESDLESILKIKEAVANDKEIFGKFQMYNTLTDKLKKLSYIKENLEIMNVYGKNVEAFNKPITTPVPPYVHKIKSKETFGFDKSELTMISEFGDTYAQMEDASHDMYHKDHKLNNVLISDLLFNKLKLEIPKNIQLFISQHTDSYLEQYLKVSTTNKSDPKFDKQKQKQYVAYLQLLIVSALLILLAGYFRKNMFNLNKQPNSDCTHSFSLNTPELYTILNLEGANTNSLLNYICCIIIDEYTLSQTYKSFLPSTIEKLYDNVYKMLKFIVKNNESLKLSLLDKLKKDNVKKNNEELKSTITNFRPNMNTIELVDSKNTTVKNGEMFRFSLADGSNRANLITSDRKSVHVTYTENNEALTKKHTIHQKNSCSLLVKKIHHSTTYNIHNFFEKNNWMYNDKILYDMDENVINEKLFKNDLLLENAMRINISSILNFIASYTQTNLNDEFLNIFMTDVDNRGKLFENIGDLNFNVIFKRLSNEFEYENQRIIKTKSKKIIINTTTKNFPTQAPGAIVSYLPEVILYNLDILKHVYVKNINTLIFVQLLMLARSIHLLFYKLFNVYLDDTDLDINGLSMQMINMFSTLTYNCFNYIIKHFQSVLKQENVNADYELEEANSKRHLKELQLNLKDKDMNILYYEFSKINKNISFNILSDKMSTDAINVDGDNDINIYLNPETSDHEGPDENNNPDVDSDDNDYDD